MGPAAAGVLQAAKDVIVLAQNWFRARSAEFVGLNFDKGSQIIGRIQMYVLER